MWTFRGELWRSCAASFSGELYAFTKQQVMIYEAEKNVWSAVASLPQYIPFFTCATQWRDQIFVGTVDGSAIAPNSYMFNPSTRRLIEFNVDGAGAFAGTVVSAATMEI
jgi:hypothetical protein